MAARGCITSMPSTKSRNGRSWRPHRRSPNSGCCRYWRPSSQQFPFLIRGFHSDNGSEFINYTVARLLEKLLIEQTRSRPHRSGDNGLVESKNGAIIRKHIGYGYIAAQHAEAMDQFHREYLNPYLNFHRPCAVPNAPHPGQRQAPQDLPALGHALRVVPGTAWLRALPAPRRHPGRTGELRPTAIRHRSRAGHAACQAQAAGQREANPDRMRRTCLAPPAGRRPADCAGQVKNQNQNRS